MKITIESTTRMVELDGVSARVWEGKTESGIPVICFIPRIAVEREEDCSEFEKELEEHQAPSDGARSFPTRMIL